jgi:hypothetical protein
MVEVLTSQVKRFTARQPNATTCKSSRFRFATANTPLCLIASSRRFGKLTSGVKAQRLIR